MGPHAALNLTISAPNGPVPPDTTLDVSWSGGQEPTFALADPTTWATLDQGANVVCKVDASAPPPTDLGQLVCHLWTLGPTHVTVHASGFTTFDQTLSPDVSERCDEPVPTDEDIVLIPLGDAGAG